MSEQERHGFFATVVAAVSAVYHAAMEGGEIQAAMRQGFREIGNALEAFPSQISVNEPGSITSPLYSDLAESQGLHTQAKEAAQEIVLRSPLEIIRDCQGYRPPAAEQSQEQGRDI